jgi:multiple sugar transport system substrate-binding protein
MSGWYADAARLIREEFEERTGARVTVFDLPYRALHERALGDLSSGTGCFDVVQIAYQWDGQFAPYLADLSVFIERDQTRMTDFVPMVAKNCGLWGPKRVGVPHAATGTGLFLRKDILAEHRLEAPTDWEEYLRLAGRMNRPGRMYGTGLAGVRKELADGRAPAF